ncbi:beta-ketoacyl synthase [Salipiger mucosus DSM 16094]|uniref:Beta-ketoacyl synthase n=1 Tax=Salipiger mucosus DSM 16094 TaxID=1123237 RepID=S9Q2U9_9RHOB|nr:beta-ketoacyl synthase [Salipiger mucosus DSM 16094]
MLVDLGPAPGPDTAALLLDACQAVLAARAEGQAPRLVALQPEGIAGGFLRSFFIETPGCDILLLNLPATDPDPETLLAEIRAAGPGFQEVTLAPDGTRTKPVWQRAAPDSADRPVPGPGDAVLVSGGGKGIGAECGLALARETGCALLLLGRSAPDEDAELQRNLDRIAATGTRLSYRRADVTDAAAVARALRQGEADLAVPVTGVIHGAGHNHPRTVANLEPALIAQTLAPKVTGLRNILAALDPGRLKLLAGFGSIIARIGLHGEADYALANEWLSREIEAFGAAHPRCRALSVEWSVWSGTGMGQKLGRLDALMAQGIQPISVDEGIAAFLRLATGDGPAGATVVSGRFGAPATVDLGQPEPPALRYVETIPVWYPGTEIVTECRIAPGTDPYLEDHVLNGQRLFPAVMALEAMTGALRTLAGDLPGAPRFGKVQFRQGLVVPGDGAMTVRVAAQRRGDGRFDLAIRCSATGFQVNHVEALCDIAEHATPETDLLPADPATTLPGLDPARALYGNVLFQKGLFARVAGYGLLEARRCAASLSPAHDARWFAADLPQARLLGDAGARDAALHAIQACIPHETVIPMSVESIETAPLDPAQAHRIAAVEREDLGNRLVYDMAIFDAQGRAVEVWRGLTLRVMGPPEDLRLDAPPLVAPFVERRIAAELHDAGLTVALAPSTGRAGPGPDRRPDGKPDRDDSGAYLSNAHGAGWRLSVRARWPVGVDLQEQPDHDRNGWTRLVGEEGMRLADALTDLTGIDAGRAATHVWAAREAMKKAGMPAGAPLSVDPASTAQWLRLRSGDWVVYASAFAPDGAARPLCLAVVVGVAEDAVGAPARLAGE